MKEKIKALIKKLFFKPPQTTVEKYKNNIIIGQNTRTEGLNIQLRNPLENKKYLSIGENSSIQGDFIFEIASGFIKIGNNTFIGGSTFICVDGIEIGDDVLFSWGCTIADNNSHSTLWSERKDDVKNWKKGLDENKIGFYKDWQNVKTAKIIIKNKAWIGFNSVILKGVTIGEGAIIAAGSVVTKDIPDWTIAAGNPAKVIKNIPENER